MTEKRFFFLLEFLLFPESLPELVSHETELAHPGCLCFPVRVPQHHADTGQDLYKQALQLGGSHTWFSTTDTVLKFFILFELGPPHFHFALGPENSVAGPAFSIICYTLPTSVHVPCSWCHPMP